MKHVENLRVSRSGLFPYLNLFEVSDLGTEIFGVFHSTSDSVKWRGRVD